MIIKVLTIVTVMFVFILLSNIQLVNASYLTDNVQQNISTQKVFKKVLINYTKIETPYGVVNVPEENVKNVGKNKIIEKYMDYINIEKEF